MKKFIAIFLVLVLVSCTNAGVVDDVRTFMNAVSSRLNAMFRFVNIFAQNTDADGVALSAERKAAYKSKFKDNLILLISDINDLNEYYAGLDPTYDIKITIGPRD